MINYEEIIENLRDDAVKQLLTELGADVIEKDDYFVLNTICHHDNPDEASHKLYYYKNTHLFVCYSECGTMSIFKFLKKYYEVRQIEYDWYNDILQVILNCSASDVVRSGAPAYKSCRDEYVAQKIRKELPAFSEGVLSVFTKFYPSEWLMDHISREAMDKYNILYSISQNKIIIPHYDIHNRLVGIRGRALNQWEVENLGKYMPVQIEGKWYSHPLSLNLYGLNMNYQNIKKTGIAFVFESEKSVLQFESFSIPNCAVASCGSNFNKYQVDLLMRYCAPREIVICYDREELPKESKYFDKLYEICSRYNNYCNMSFIYDTGLGDLKDSPSDNGEEVFQKLLKGRVKVK